MNEAIIKVEGLGKKYIISHEQARGYTALRDVISKKAKGIFRKNENKQVTKEEFWALKDVSFEVKRGEAIGIIGRNGAGKSTLLKILSRITEPSTGHIEINGRVASLLEVGTGFHPELTGRENIFLNGAILGMSRVEIKRKFDEIVDFSGVEKFLDTPVKRYSSGMYVRLAFAVAAHLEPEILVVDEVLAVGDAEFQKKCLGKMDEVSHKEGRTVFFVSHNMGAISQLCGTALLLNRGELIHAGKTDEVINSYLQQGNQNVEKIERGEEFPGNHFKSAYMCDAFLKEKTDYRFDEEIYMKVDMMLPEYSKQFILSLSLIDKNKNTVFLILEELDKYSIKENIISLQITIPPKFLTPGNYSWRACIFKQMENIFDMQEDVLPFTVMETGSDFARYEGANIGPVFARYAVKALETRE